MSIRFRRFSVSSAIHFAAVPLLVLMLHPADASAQSGKKAPSRTSRPQASQAKGQQGQPEPSQARQGGVSKAASENLALSGYCPVCVVDLKQWVKGDPTFSVDHDGKRYLFPGEEQKQMFVNNPAKYIPAMGGDCTVCQVEMGKRIAGSVQFAAMHRGRLFLFPGEEQKQMFQQNPQKYADSDLAVGGQCTVCRVEMNEPVAGNPDFAAFYDGLRYLFPGPDQQKMFLDNPEKYAVGNDK